MIKINLQGDVQPFMNGINNIKEFYDFDISNSGCPVYIKKSDRMRIEEDTIYYTEKAGFFRLLVKYLSFIRDSSFLNVTENKIFEKICIMIDVSRNAVMKISKIKELLCYMAGFGINTFMLYTEDTYAVEEYPYMGYFRGRYTPAELREVDRFAKSLGIEMIPCLEMLGHCEHVLRWYPKLSDTADVLLADEEQTYQYIESCIKTMSENISSSYIHIGMDEAGGMGKGAYLAKHGETDRFELFTRHLNRVVEICRKYGKQPIMWSDMYFSMAGGKYWDLDTVLTKDITDKIPDVDLVYWDYYSINPERYRKMIAEHSKTGKDIWFAGGIWTFSGYAHLYSKTKATFEAGVKECIKAKVKNVMLASWCDGGGICPHFAGLNAYALLGEYAYCGSDGNVRGSFKCVTGEDINTLNYYEYLDHAVKLKKQDYSVTDQAPSSLARTLLFQDIMLGLLDMDYADTDFNQYYRECYEEISEMKTRKFVDVNDFYRQLAFVLSEKSDAGRILTAAYHNADQQILQTYAENILPELKVNVEALRSAHRKMWNFYNKPFGFEVIDLRYGGVIARISSCMEALDEYLSGKTDRIPEFEEERLPYLHNWHMENDTAFRAGLGCIVTTGNL